MRRNSQSQANAAADSQADSRPGTHTLATSLTADLSRQSALPTIGSSSPVFRQTELDPDVSLAPLRRSVIHQNSTTSGLPDLTVYF